MAAQYFFTTIGTAAAGDHAIDVAGEGDRIYIDTGVAVGADGAGANGLESAFGNHVIEVHGHLGSTLGRGIHLSGNSNGNHIFISNTGAIGAYGGDAIRLDGVTVGNSFNDVATSGTIISTVGYGIFSADVDLGVINSGYINGDGDTHSAIRALSGSVVNQATGVIAAGIVFSSIAGQESEVFNYGIIGGGGGTVNTGGAITGGAGIETVFNYGTLAGGINLGDGADLYDGSGGGRVLGGSIGLGAGNDEGIGSDQRDVFVDGLGNDVVDANGGNDMIGVTATAAGTDGNDVYDGGAGIDTFTALVASAGVIVDLNAGTSTGARTGNDLLSGIERVFGSNFGDTIIGDGADNLIRGNNGNDIIFGGGGVDIIDGGVNTDTINGGAGRDRLTGGTQSDVFVFSLETDSGPTAATRDIITDFVHLGDDIDISALLGTFTFIGGAAFSAAGNEVRFQAEGSNTVVQISTDTDVAAEMSILLYGTIALDATDFIL